MSDQNLLSKIEQGFADIQVLWMVVAERQRCLYCKTSFPDGVANRHPGVSEFHLDSRFWFTAAFLHHVHATHGFSPDAMTNFLEVIAESDALTKPEA